MLKHLLYYSYQTENNKNLNIKEYIMKTWYSFKYQEQKIREFIKKHKNKLDYSKMMKCGKNYLYNRLHNEEYLYSLKNLRDKMGRELFIMPVFTTEKNKRVLLWIYDDFVPFTDARLKAFEKELCSKW